MEAPAGASPNQSTAADSHLILGLREAPAHRECDAPKNNERTLVIRSTRDGSERPFQIPIIDADDYSDDSL